MLHGKTYVNEVTLMRGFQYKDKEGVEMFLGKSTLTRGFSVIDFKSMIK